MELQAEYVANVFRSIRQEVGKAVVGNDEIINLLLTAFYCGGHVLLEGVPGLGKTLMVKSLATVLGLDFHRIQFTPDLMPADIIGTTIVVQGEGGDRAFRFQKGPLFTNLLLADEINRATAKTQSALLEAMAESTVTVAGKTRPLGDPFFVMATQNPLEMDGTYRLPEAQLDRFFFKVMVDLPTKQQLMAIVDCNISNTKVELERKASPQSVIQIKALVRDVPISDRVKDYAARLVLATQPANPGAPAIIKKNVAYGASPRGLLALVHGAKARALASGRLNVSIEDLKALAIPVLRHRIILNFEGEAEGITPEHLIERLTSFGEDDL
jgi:MoxR-like ATPase